MEPEHRPEKAISEHSSTDAVEKTRENGTEGKTGHLEAIRTVSRVPNPHYYEKDGLRTYGDDEDHDHEPPVRTYLRNWANYANMREPDDHSPFDVPHRHGLFVDWISNTCIPVRCVNTVCHVAEGQELT
jgi:hypothetical protein